MVYGFSHLNTLTYVVELAGAQCCWLVQYWKHMLLEAYAHNHAYALQMDLKWCLPNLISLDIFEKEYDIDFHFNDHNSVNFETLRRII